MKQKIDPKFTDRAHAFKLWMKSPQPMVTMVKTFDVTYLCKISRRRNKSVNMLLCWCIGKAASNMDCFYLLPEKGALYKYDRLAVNVIAKNKEGDISSCDIPFTDDLEQFCNDYATLTREVISTCKNFSLDDAMVIGTSALVETELDCIVNQYTDLFCNPMLFWGKYRKGWFKTSLPISFQFHHVQMDGGHAAHFLKLLQTTLNSEI